MVAANAMETIPVCLLDAAYVHENTVREALAGSMIEFVADTLREVHYGRKTDLGQY